METALFAKTQYQMNNIGFTLGHIRDMRTMPHLPREGHLVIGKEEVLTPLSTLMIILQDNSESHPGFLFAYDLYREFIDSERQQ
jgi:hypothetical protein